MHNSVTQSVLGPTGHHLLNRAADGTLDAHLASWSGDAVVRAHANLYDEILRVERYQAKLQEIRHALFRRAGDCDTVDA